MAKITKEDLHEAAKLVEDAAFHLSWADPCDPQEKFSIRLMDVVYLLSDLKDEIE
jgi:hypothetical protein